VELPSQPIWPPPRPLRPFPATILPDGARGARFTVDLRWIARRRRVDLTSVGGGEAEERMGFGTHPPRRPSYMRAKREFGLRPGSFFRPNRRCGVAFACRYGGSTRDSLMTHEPQLNVRILGTY
jgi:hypothetical protein